MPVSITDKTTNPLLDEADPTQQTLTPFTALTVTDALNAIEAVSVTLTAPGQPAGTALGTLADPNGGGTFVNGVFTETGVNTTMPTYAQTVLSRLVYTPPTLPDGTSYVVNATVAVAGVTDPTPVQIDLVSAPSIMHTTANQPVLGGSPPTRPFATVVLADNDFAGVGVGALDDATIKITDANGNPTDLGGAFQGPGLSHTGTGLYTVTGYAPWNLAFLLNNLTFATLAQPTGSTFKANFELDVTDEQAKLTKTDTNTSLLITGPPTQPVPPTITGTVANQQVEAGNVLSPFHAVTIGDSNAGAMDTVTITVTNAAGTATDSVGTFGAEPYLTHTPGSGVYTLAAATPTTLTTELDTLVFTPGTGAANATANMALSVKDTVGIGLGQTATDNVTSTTEVATTTPTPPGNPTPPNQPPNAAGNFLVHDETTGQAYQSPGETYTGPVAGITSDIIFAISDNVNVTAEVPNVFIHTGSGQDGLTALSGTNILDGSTNSNFLTGGTGNDTFYLDDRGPATPIFSTIVNFHSGDAVTVFGVTSTDFTLTKLDNQGAPGFTGLDMLYHKDGQPDVSFVLAGYTSADLTSGKLTMIYANETDGTPFMTLYGH